MKLSEFMNYLNSALNFPSIEINDVLVYLDMAVAELNTTLHTEMIPMSKQLEQYVKSKLKGTKLISLSNDPSVDNDIFVKETVDEIVPAGTKIYYDYVEKHYYILEKGNYVMCDSVLGVYFRDAHTKEYWSPYRVGSNAHWEFTDRTSADSYDLSEFLTYDWLMLWLLPYVCFKYTVRDGGSAQTFAEELTQGFQQLQDTYNVPETVNLATYADKEIYRDLVEEHLPNLNVKVGTRAIYESMKHDRNVLPEYGSMYDRGGF